MMDPKLAPEASDAFVKNGKLEIRPLGEKDLEAAMRLKELSQWNQTEGDWRRLLDFGPQGCFAACLDQQVVGTVTTAVYGTDLAWIGMMLVAPEYRRRGLGKRLMQAALAYLDRVGVATIKLDATAAGRPLYESLGFVTEGLIERWEGVAPSTREKESAITQDLPFEAVYALDRQAFGADRRPWIKALSADAPFPPLVVRRPGEELKGYGLVRRGSKAFYVGPVVAKDQEAALSLLDGILFRLAGERIYLDFNTGFNLDVRVLTNRGFVKQRDLLRMSLGRKSSAGTSSLIFGIAGPEMG
jgi:GNAT superfamily N-acetyltransferase